MKTVITLFISLLFLSVNVVAQDDDGWVSKKYDIDDFSSLRLYGGYKVFLSQGKQTGIEVKARDYDVLDNLKVENWGDELSLIIKEEFFAYKRIRVYVTFKELNEIAVEGGLNLESDGYLDLDDLDLQIQGGAKIDLQMKADDVKVTGEGGVLIDLNGVANSLMVKLSGAGHLDANELKTKDVDIEIEGVGTGSVYATEKLHTKIEGVGKVSYKGDPKVIKEIDGLGSVKRY